MGAALANDTIGFYDANAAHYAAASTVNRKLERFLNQCKSGGTILELGTGSGLDAKAMLDAGYVVDATDGSAELAALASVTLGQRVRTMAFTELSAVTAYDGIYASASLLHVPREELPDVVRRIWTALKPGGVVWASFKTGQAEGHDALGRYYNYLSVGELLQLWSASGQWSAVSAESWLGSGFDGEPTRWAAVSAFRRAKLLAGAAQPDT
jgi:SAM-dependent methyltransferase